MQESRKDVAILSSYDKYTTFSFGGKKLTFRTCNGLERYTKYCFGIKATLRLWLNTSRRKMRLKNILIQLLCWMVYIWTKKSSCLLSRK